MKAWVNQIARPLITRLQRLGRAGELATLLRGTKMMLREGTRITARPLAGRALFGRLQLLPLLATSTRTGVSRELRVRCSETRHQIDSGPLPTRRNSRQRDRN